MGQSRKRVGRDGKARYTAYYDDVAGRRRSAGTFASRRDADRAWQRADAKTAEGRHSDAGRGRQAFARYVEDEWFPNHSIELTTRQNYRYVLDKHILPVFGGYKMIAILPADVRTWVTHLKDQGVKPATIKYCLSVLSAIFTTALNDQITSLHPCAGIKAPTVPPATRRIITPEQYARIHAALPDEQMRLLVETDIETGLRWGELVELRVRDLRVAEGAVIVSRVVIEIAAKFHPSGGRFLVKDYPKDKAPRRVGLSAHVRDLLAAHVTGKAPDDLLFAAPARDRASKLEPVGDQMEFGMTEPNAVGKSYRHGTLTAYNMVPCRCQHCRNAYATYRAERRANGADKSRAANPPPLGETDPHISRSWFRQQIWEPALADAGLGFHVRVHDLRHAHASWLLAGGADLQSVKDRMGHARLTTTEQYLHSLPHADAAAIAALDHIRKRTT
ncbi:site-specific integrase [Jatrophihabitans cynanchi]|uniref:Site-specific integrase n=1 Tax=Jatrophihabitans cynanchi TaxID=2944128 RepID=A0ABY7K0P5_9ACTN|nr:site-specific integrase [Jatrophihabitans sp. SB3-54]WAX58421.1 site-specific integrase [Jatrophihabitans sp. SB3-54]